MGAILTKPVLSKVIEREGHPHFASAVCEANGYRKSMEDAHGQIFDKGTGRSFFGVFDGHGGDACAIYMGRELPPIILGLPKWDPESVEAACLKADEDFLKLAQDGGTTGTMILVEKQAEDGSGKFPSLVANVGDSRVLVIRKNPSSASGVKCVFVTEDHKPGNPGERARITRAGGTVRMERVDGDLAVSRAFGDATFKTRGMDPRQTKVICVPEFTRLDLLPGDFLIVCCDGVFEANFTTEEVTDYFGSLLDDAKAQPKCGDWGTVAAKIVDQAIRRGSKDNITCLCAQVGVDGRPMVEKHSPKSFVPGPPDMVESGPFRSQWAKMAQHAGIDPITALRKRMQLVKLRASCSSAEMWAAAASELPVWEQMAFDMQDENDIAAEAKWFAQAPADEQGLNTWCQQKCFQ